MKNESIAGHFLQNTFGDRYLYEVNGSAFDKVGAEACFSKQYGKALFAENSLYVVCGTDSGLLPKYVAEQGVPEGTYYIFVELPEVLEAIQPALPADGFHKKIILAKIDDWLSQAKEIEYQNFIYLDSLKFVQSFAATDGRYSEYLEFATMLQEDLEKIQWGIKSELGCELFHLRQLENLPENRLPSVALKGAFSKQVAIVLGGGPSLDEIFPWLIENRERLVVFAVSRIARRLLDLDFSPDFVISVDPSGYSFDVSKEMLHLWEKSIFIHKYHVVSSLSGQWRGRSFFSGPRTPWKSTLNNDLLDSSGPTVTNSAIDLAIMMGFSEIMLAGVDLCHSSDGYTHAKGSNEREMGPQLGQGKLWVETNGGEMAETTPDFHSAAARINAQAAAANEGGCRVINLASGATKLEAVDYLTCEEVVLPTETFSVSGIISSFVPDETAETRTAYYQQALTELLRAENAFREIRKLARAALKANDAFFGKQRGVAAGLHKHKAKMDRIDKKLKNDYPDFTYFIKKFGIKDFLKMTQGDRDREWDREDVEKLGRFYYEAYDSAVDRLQKVVANAAARVRVRLEEEKPEPDFTRMIAQWKEDQQPGRVLVWQQAHPECSLSDEISKEFSVLEGQFNEVMQQQDTAHLQRSKAHAQLGLVRGKLQVMLKRRQTENLSRMVTGLEQLDSAEAKSLACLGRGYLAELQNNTDLALSEYQQIIDLQEEYQDQAILEDTLKRFLSLLLQINDYDNARIVAECLVGISIVNMPYYADLLWLLGDRRTALDAYADYFDQVPTDTGAMIKVGRYYQEEGVTEGAAMMFEAVLEQDPWNKVAKQLLEDLEKKVDG